MATILQKIKDVEDDGPVDMIKQLLGKIPRKPSKSLQGDSNGDRGVNAYSSMNFCNGPISSNSSKPNSSSKSSNSVSGVSWSSNGTLVPNSSSVNKSNGDGKDSEEDSSFS